LNRRKKWRYGNVKNVDMRRKVAASPGNAPSAAKPVPLLKKRIQAALVAVAAVPASSGG